MSNMPTIQSEKQMTHRVIAPLIMQAATNRIKSTMLTTVSTSSAGSVNVMSFIVLVVSN